MFLTLALLGALFKLGTDPPVTASVTWEIEYADGVIASYTSMDWNMEFNARPYWPWRARYLVLPTGVWSEWGRWIPADPYPGDCDQDGVVSGSDFQTILDHWEEIVP